MTRESGKTAEVDMLKILNESRQVWIRTGAYSFKKAKILKQAAIYTGHRSPDSLQDSSCAPVFVD